jgi:hypothetical protein
MLSKFSKKAAILAGLATLADAGASGSGKATRYWDCCKVLLSTTYHLRCQLY